MLLVAIYVLQVVPAQASMRLGPDRRPSAAQLLASHPLAAYADRTAGGSIAGLQQSVERSSWVVPLRVPGLQWLEQPAAVAAHAVKLCDVSSADASHKAAAEQLFALVTASAGNEKFRDQYPRRSKIVLCHARPREMQLMAQAIDLNHKYANRSKTHACI